MFSSANAIITYRIGALLLCQLTFHLTLMPNHRPFRVSAVKNEDRDCVVVVDVMEGHSCADTGCSPVRVARWSGWIAGCRIEGLKGLWSCCPQSDPADDSTSRYGRFQYNGVFCGHTISIYSSWSGRSICSPLHQKAV